MSTMNTCDDYPSMGGLLWRRVESWVRSQVYRDQLCQIDVEQGINDAMYQWSKIADAEEMENANTSVTPLLGSIIRRRLRNAIQFENRAKRDASMCRQMNTDESFTDSYPAFGQIDADDTQRVLSMQLSKPELAILQLRIRGHDWSKIQRLLGISSSDVRVLRRKLETHSNSFFFGGQESSRT